mgnify:FL=1
MEIIAVHDNGSHSYILVKNFPFSDKGKINWWLKNKDKLKNEYDIPKLSNSGNFTVIFWLFRDGYKETDGYDRLCFEDLLPPLNCIDKDAVFSVSNSINLGTVFTVYDGKYQLKKNGDIAKLEIKFDVK